MLLLAMEPSNLLARCSAWLRPTIESLRWPLDATFANVAGGTVGSARLARSESVMHTGNGVVAHHGHSAIAAQTKRVTPVAVGMVQLGSLTFRILRLTETSYGIVRLLDDRYLGSFQSYPSLELASESAGDRDLLRSVARLAIQQGRTSWSMAR